MDMPPARTEYQARVPTQAARRFRGPRPARRAAGDRRPEGPRPARLSRLVARRGPWPRQAGGAAMERPWRASGAGQPEAMPARLRRALAAVQPDAVAGDRQTVAFLPTTSRSTPSGSRNSPRHRTGWIGRSICSRAICWTGSASAPPPSRTASWWNGNGCASSPSTRSRNPSPRRRLRACATASPPGPVACCRSIPCRKPPAAR